MKYFTKELCFTNDDSEETTRKWIQNTEAYYKEYDAIKSRFSKRFVQIYERNHGFHDFQLIRFEILNRESGRGKDRVWLILYIKNWEKTYKLTYKHISKLHIDYIRHGEWGGFEDWRYNELLPIDEYTMSHEILFVSGAIIKVHFENRFITILDITGK